jgi:hypothetical protein
VIQVIAARAAAILAVDVQHIVIDFADEITQYDRGRRGASRQK